MQSKLWLQYLIASGPLAACTAARPVEVAPPPMAAEPSAPTSTTVVNLPLSNAARAPLILKIEGPSLTPTPGARIELTARVSKLGRRPGAVELRVTLPPGASLAEGPEASLIEDTGPGESVRRFVIVTGAEIPSDDVRFTASLQGAGFGATAHAVYRFGRPGPALSSVPGHVLTSAPANAVRLAPPPSVNGIRPPATVPLPPSSRH